MSNKILLAVVVAILIVVYFFSSDREASTTLKSVERANAYMGTTTKTGFQTSYVLASCPGELGNVNITVVGTDSFVLYDATSTTLGLSYWPDTALFSAGPSQAVGNFNIDRVFTKGLMLKFTNNGTIGSTTITWRQSC